MKPALTQDRLKELLHYDPETGLFTWLASNSNRALSGSRAGSLDGHGYIRIRIDGTLRSAHRLAFLYITGEVPPKDVDHANRDKSDNRWVNLRPATRWENMGNTGLQSNSTSGHRGVTWDARARKWLAHGRRGSSRIHLGLFNNLEEAAAAAQAWREENFGVFAAV